MQKRHDLFQPDSSAAGHVYLSSHLFTVQEEERQIIARELHDDVSLRLSFLELLLKDPADNDQKEGNGRRIEELRHKLHPAILDDLDLPSALKAS